MPRDVSRSATTQKVFKAGYCKRHRDFSLRSEMTISHHYYLRCS